MVETKTTGEKEPVKEEVKEPVKEPEDKKTLSPVDEAKAILEEIKKEKAELILENAKKEKLISDNLLSGSSGGHIEPKKPTRLTDIEYAEALQRGEVNPLKEDGFI